MAQSNIFEYENNSPIDADFEITAANPDLVPVIKFIDSKFSPSATTSGGTYNGLAEALEHYAISGEVWIGFTEQPLHLLLNDVANSRIIFNASLSMTNIVADWWQTYMDDLLTLALNGTVRVVELEADINDVIFKRISMKSPVHIETYGKYYGIIEVEKNGDLCTFKLLELF